MLWTITAEPSLAPVWLPYQPQFFVLKNYICFLSGSQVPLCYPGWCYDDIKYSQEMRATVATNVYSIHNKREPCTPAKLALQTANATPHLPPKNHTRPGVSRESLRRCHGDELVIVGHHKQLLGTMVLDVVPGNLRALSLLVFCGGFRYQRAQP